MAKIKHYFFHAMIIVMAIALAITMFSTLIYQFKKSRKDLIDLSANHAEMVIDTIIEGIRTTAGIRKNLYNEKIPSNIVYNVLKKYGTGALIQKIEKTGKFHYIACQDENQIIVATKGVKELSSVWSDAFLSKAFISGKVMSRILPEKKYYFETVKTFSVDGKKYLLRVCIKASYIRRLELHLIRRLAIQAFIFIFIIIILVLYFINVHSNQILARERDNIMAEVEEITQQLRQQERVAAMGRLAAGVAHEIRNPLNAIQILVQRTEREISIAEKDKDKFQDFIRVIRDEIKRLNDIVKQFLDFATPKQPEFKKCNPEKIINDLIVLESGVAKQKNIKINVNIQKNITNIYADEHLIKQALVNVIKNAIEATPDNGEITISVNNQNNFTIFIIEDSGTGLSDDEKEKAFDLYYSTKEDGSGLGLAITKRIIDAHNGNISILKRKTSGTSVIIKLPNSSKNEHINNR